MWITLPETKTHLHLKIGQDDSFPELGQFRPIFRGKLLLASGRVNTVDGRNPKANHLGCIKPL